MKTPAWVTDAVFYQIFPDRFFNGDDSNDPPNVVPWGTKPDLFNFMGGDLAGIHQKLDYLQDLGVNAIYLNPIFLSSSSHRYNTFDYFTIDPKLGTLADFSSFLQSAHQRGMHVILDGVFNHCGRGFFAFVDVLENGDISPYRDWFHIRKFPLRAYTAGRARNFAAWWGFKSLPKFNTQNPQVRAYLFRVAQYWLEQGIDGWRLDVPSEIDDDGFWAEFEYHVRAVQPEAYLVGEIWDGDPRWVSPGHFDGLMHYPLREVILEALTKKISASDFVARLDGIQRRYPEQRNQAMYTLLGSHDTERIFTILEGNSEKVRSAFMLQFALPGVPSIYYGDEIGLEGFRDPDNRRAFPWDPYQWNLGIRVYLQRMIELRKQHTSLRFGEQVFLCSEDGCEAVAIFRSTDTDRVLCVVNLSDSFVRAHFTGAGLSLPEGGVQTDLLGGQAQTHSTGNGLAVELNAWSCACFSV